jgi:large subunit ribosomal protein L3
MLTTVFATKLGMTQAWTKQGKRCAVTKCKLQPNVVLSQEISPISSESETPTSPTRLEIGYGTKKSQNMSKALRTKVAKSGYAQGVAGMGMIKVNEVPEGETVPAVGSTLKIEDVFAVGDVVDVQGITKGRGFAGAMKRHGFHGGPRTHGQSDRSRAVGSIGPGTTPGRVWKGKRMPGHYGAETQSVLGLTVLHVDPANQEIWLSGPVPGFATSTIVINKTGQKRDVELNPIASGIKISEAPTATTENETPDTAETTQEVAA